MTLSRRPTRLIMPEIAIPASVPTNMAELFARDDGAGTTKVSYMVSGGGAVDLGPSGGGGGGGSPTTEFINCVRDKGADPLGAVDSYPAISSALSQASNGNQKVVWLPGGRYRSNSQISVPSGVKLMGPRLAGEGTYAEIFAGAAGLTALVQLASGAMLEGLTINAGTNAARAVSCVASATMATHVVARGGTQHTWVGIASQNRHRWDHLTLLGDGIPSVAVFEIYSTDHLVDSVWAEGPGSGGHAFVVNGNTGMFANIHALASNGANAPTGTSTAVRINRDGTNGGSQNSLVNVYAYGCGPTGEAPVVNWGARNMIANCHVFGAANGKPAASIRGNKEGNMFFGLSYDDDVNPSSRIMTFLDGSGNLSNTPGNFLGTRVMWSSVNTLTVSGAYHNLTNPSTGIDIVGYATGGTVGGTIVRT